jgi:type II secretory pathway component PulF
VQTNLVLWVIEPVLLLTLAFSVGLLVIALFLPLIKLLNDLS